MTSCATWGPWMSTKLLAEGEPAMGLRWETGRKNGCEPYRVMRPALNPCQRASLRVMESGDASAVSPRETGPAREPWHVCAGADWTRQGTDGFLGHERCQGQTCGWQARRPEALSLRGGWCGARTADTTRKQTGMRLRPQVGVECAKRHATERRCQKLCREEYGLLTGAF